MTSSENESKADERFYTPRAQASTARSTGSYGTPRSFRSSVASSSDDGEFGTPRNFEYVRHHTLVGLPKTDRRNLIPPHNHSLIQGGQSLTSSTVTHHQTSHFRFDREDGDEESRGEDQYQGGRARREVRIFEPSKTDIENIWSFTRHGRIAEVDDLLSRGVPADVRDDNGNSILAVACQNNDKRLAKLALRRGADINASNLVGNTPLHFCYKYGHIKLGEYLISKGADRELKNMDGQTCESFRQLNL